MRVDTKAIKKMVIEKTGLRYSDLSATSDYSSLNIHVKAFYPLSVIEKLVSDIEKVDRCDRSGEILSGGNFFVFVSYNRDIVIPDDMKKVIFDVVQSINLDSGVDNIPKNAKLHLLNEACEVWLFNYVWKKVGAAIGDEWTPLDISRAVHTEYEFFKTLTINN